MTKPPPKPNQQGKGTKTKTTHKKIKVPSTGLVRKPRAPLDVSKMTLNGLINTPGGPKGGDKMSAKLQDAITAASLESTLAGASTLQLTITDWYHTFLRSQLLTGSCTLTFDGIGYTLVKLSAAGDDTVQLTFEETAVNLLRKYTKPLKANRANTTRAQFVQTMVKEVSEARIPFVCPELNTVQPIGKTAATRAIAMRSDWRRRRNGSPTAHV